MKITLSIGLAALALGLEGDTPQYTCKKGDTRSCAWTRAVETEIKSSTLSIMGGDRDIGSDSTSTTSLTLEFSEEIKEANEDGAPARIIRNYGTVMRDQEREGLESTDEMRVVDNDANSELEGQTVVFTLDQDSEEWSAAFDEESTRVAKWIAGNIQRRRGLRRMEDGRNWPQHERPHTAASRVLAKQKRCCAP